MQARERAGLPILGINHQEERLDDAALLTVKKYGPCPRCGERGWLSDHKTRGLLCESCFIGPGYEPDPIVDDIRSHLGKVYHQAIGRWAPEDSHSTITKDLHEEVACLICPECQEEARRLTKVLSQWVCGDCIEAAGLEVRERESYEQ